MATATLNWTPGGGGTSLSQDINYKTIDALGYTFHSNVSASTNTVDITGLSNNTIYQFLITNNCVSGIGALSSIAEAIHFACPVVDLDITYNSVTFTFTHPGGDITGYHVYLLDDADDIISPLVFTSPGGTVTDSFTGLTPETNYGIRVVPDAVGDLDTYSVECDIDHFTTEAVVCNTPTGVSASLYVPAD